MSAKSVESSPARRQFITFRSDGQDFGADIMQVQEIRGWTETTVLPDTPDYVRGVVNLRGRVLPVLDMKSRLGRGLTKADSTHVIVIVKSGDTQVGILVDAVSDILTLLSSDIQPAPALARFQQDGLIEGIAVLDQGLVTILSMDHLTANIALPVPEAVAA